MTDPRTDAPATPLGTYIGGFLLQERLGAGGMAEVFLAARAGPECTELAALKRLLPHLTFDVEFVRMFLGEVKLMAELDHVGIAKVLEYGTGEGGHFLAMEYVHGHDVRDVLGKISGRGAPLDFAIGVVADLADALHHAHEFRSSEGVVRGLVHRDVSPSNVRIRSDGAIKLIDFGIAHVTGQTRITKAGTVKGKVGYMSPEQCRAETVDRRTDIFALGVMLYELTTGRRAFFGSSDFETLARIIQGRFTAPRAAKPDLPTEIAALIVHMLSTEAAKRPSTAAEVSQTLRNFASRNALLIDAASRAAYLRSLFGNVSSPPLPHSAPTLHAAPPQAEPSPAAAVVVEEREPRRRAPLVALGLLVAAVGAGGFVAGQQASTPTTQPAAFEEPAVVAQPIPVNPQPEPEPDPETEPEPEPELEPEPETEPEPEPETEPEPEILIEVDDAEPPPRRTARSTRTAPASRPKRPAEPPAEPPEPSAARQIDPDSLLAPSLRQ